MTNALRFAVASLLTCSLLAPRALAQSETADDLAAAAAAEEAAALETLRARDEARARREAEIEAELETSRALARAPRDADDDDVYARFELTMGFAGGYASYADLGFSGSPALAPSAFDAGPASGTAMAGLRYDLRLVVAFLRMTVGGDFMWGLFDASSARTLEDGTAVSDRRVFDGALRFGLGLEASVDGVRLFADVLGTVHFTEVDLAQQESVSTYRAISFAPGLRLGVRVPIVPHFFVQLSVDGSPFGPSYVGGDLSVGGAIE